MRNLIDRYRRRGLALAASLAACVLLAAMAPSAHAHGDPNVGNSETYNDITALPYAQLQSPAHGANIDCQSTNQVTVSSHTDHKVSLYNNAGGLRYNFWVPTFELDLNDGWLTDGHGSPDYRALELGPGQFWTYAGLSETGTMTPGNNYADAITSVVVAGVYTLGALHTHEFDCVY